MGKIPDALRARLAKRGIDVPTEADGEGDGTRMSKRARGGASTSDAKEEERFAVAALDRMNRELDRWARETYGG